MSDAARLDDESLNHGSACDVEPAAPAAQSEGETCSRSEPEQPRRGELIPFLAAQEKLAQASRLRFSARDEAPPHDAAKLRDAWDWRRLRAAASLAAVVAIGGAAAAEHVHALRLARADQTQAHSLTERLDSMSTRLESLDTNRSRDELTSLRKVLAEIKSGAASTRDVGGAVGQLSARVDRLEKDQSARLDKLAERIEHDASTRLTDVAARLDKLEAKPVASVAAAAAAAAKPTTAAKIAAAKAAPGVSTETTGSIDRPQRLRRFYVAEIHNGYAMIGGPTGEFVVGPGDLVPGGGRVLRIERHGRGWAVVTTEGQIVASDE